MALFTDIEKALLQDALSLYLQLTQQRFPKTEFEKQYRLVQSLVDKIESANEGGPTDGPAKPRGISDEWYENCCLHCPMLSPNGTCTDKITEKFPGKCDPIIKYERGKPTPLA